MVRSKPTVPGTGLLGVSSMTILLYSCSIFNMLHEESKIVMELTPNSPVPGTVGLDLTIDFIISINRCLH